MHRRLDQGLHGVERLQKNLGGKYVLLSKVKTHVVSNVLLNSKCGTMVVIEVIVQAFLATRTKMERLYTVPSLLQLHLCYSDCLGIVLPR